MTADCIALFEQRLTANSGVVTRVSGLPAAVEHACGLTVATGGRAVAAAGWSEAELALIGPLVAAAGLELLTGDPRRRAVDLHTGLTPALWAVAETGTLIVDSAAEDVRLASMLCQLHVAVLPVGRVRASLRELEPELAGLMGRGPGYLAFISGPSRTADIERVLTIGVHGPAQLYVALLED